MNLYKSTGKKMEGWPQWVGRLVVEKEELILRNRKLEEEMEKIRASKRGGVDICFD